MPRRASKSKAKTSPTPASVVGANLERCIFCQGTRIVRKGVRRKKLETIQLWRCHDCDRVFTPQRAKGKTYPLKLILEALILYYFVLKVRHIAASREVVRTVSIKNRRDILN